MFEKFLFRSVAALIAAALLATAARAKYIPVRNPGNDPDTEVMNDGTTGYGSVDYVYWIGKYEVTNAEYCEFLNKVGRTDTYGLYDTRMASGGGGAYDIGGINRSGSPDGYSYSVRTGFANKPVNWVSWYDCLRFANWLHNGQPGDGQDATTTEDGAYTLTGPTSFAPGDHPIHGVNGRKAGARVWLPSEDEWYKAAYYKGGGTNAGYWDYATQSNTTPSNNPPATDTGNSANYGFAVGWPHITDVGAYARSAGAYGTFDQTGNLWEFNESLIRSGDRDVRGGSFNYEASYLPAAYRSYGTNPAIGYFDMGFRVATIPEPGSMTLLVCGLVAGLIWWRRRR